MEEAAAEEWNERKAEMLSGKDIRDIIPDGKIEEQRKPLQTSDENPTPPEAQHLKYYRIALLEI